VVVLTLQMELMLTVSVGDCIAFQQICPITLTTCKSATTKRLCCICNIYYYCILRRQSVYKYKMYYLIVIVQCCHINNI
jgi:hypothetical protein